MTVENMLSALPSTTTTPSSTDPGVIVRTVGGDIAGGLPAGSTMVTASSGNVAAAVAAAAIPAAGAAVMNYVNGFILTGSGATAASVILVTLAGVLGGTMTFALAIPAGVTVNVPPLIITFPKPIPASALNTAITASSPSFGAGNTNAAMVIHGFKI
jgi:hypothetical protein